MNWLDNSTKLHKALTDPQPSGVGSFFLFPRSLCSFLLKIGALISSVSSVCERIKCCIEYQCRNSSAMICHTTLSAIAKLLWKKRSYAGSFSSLSQDKHLTYCLKTNICFFVKLKYVTSFFHYYFSLTWECFFMQWTSVEAIWGRIIGLRNIGLETFFTEKIVVFSLSNYFLEFDWKFPKTSYLHFWKE